MATAARRQAWLGERTTLAAVVVLAALWSLATVAAPGFIAWLRVDSTEKSLSEGPCEWFENVLLVACVLAWGAAAWWVRRNPVALAIAVAMGLQTVLLLGEELDWGRELGLVSPGGYRNLRRAMLGWWGVPETLGSILLMGVFGAFFVLPLVPIGPLRRWLERMGPVRAEPGDALALYSVPVLWLLTARVAVPLSVEFVQLAIYAVVAIVTLRVALATRADVASRPA